MNLKIKFRELPLARAVLREKASEYLSWIRTAPTCSGGAGPRKPAAENDGAGRKFIRHRETERGALDHFPAVAPVDSARVQTVTAEKPLFYKLLAGLGKQNCGVLINTSFNVRGKPIVCAPREAFVCLMRTNMDYLVMGNFILDKAAQKPLETDSDWKKEYEPD